ncbi:peptidylprolyl isomerase, partial [Bacteroidota bacterium]
LQYQAQGFVSEGNINCDVLEELLLQKLLIHQAKIDSIMVGEIEVESELNRRMEYFISQIGSKEKLEEYYKKSIVEIKEDLRELIREQLLAQKMQGGIIGDIKVTPSEVKKFYNDIPRDSLPYVESEIEIRQIVLYPPFSEKAIYEVRERLLDLRKRIIEGEKFSTLAILYSEDPGSARNGGELGFVSRNDLVPEFSDAAFKLKKNGVSNIIETEFGYHIIQLIDRDENRINVRHILMKPKTSPESRIKAMTRLDSISKVIRLDSLTFEQAVYKFSEDLKTKTGGGVMINMQKGNSKFEMDELSKADYFAIKDLKIGEISEPYESFDDKGKSIYKIIQLKSKSKPHKANLKEDYNLISEMAKSTKQQEIINNWIEEKQAEAYIRIESKYQNCKFQTNGWFK